MTTAARGGVALGKLKQLGQLEQHLRGRVKELAAREQRLRRAEQQRAV